MHFDAGSGAVPEPSRTKQKYIYYRCSHFKERCPEPYVREERLLEQFTDLIAQVSLAPKMYEWLGRALKENVPIVEAEHARRIDTLRRDQDDIRERMKQAYIDNVDGKIDDDLFNRLIADYRDDERKILRQLERLMDADHAYLDEGIELIAIARDARRTFAEASQDRKQSVLLTLLSNYSYRDGQVTATFRKLYDIIMEKLPREKLLEGSSGAKTPKTAEWLPELDSNQRPLD